MLVVAKEALRLLHSDVTRENATKNCDLQESIILRCLIHVTEKLVTGSKTSSCTQEGENNLCSDFAELAKLYNVALDRFHGRSSPGTLEKPLYEDNMYESSNAALFPAHLSVLFLANATKCAKYQHHHKICIL